MAILRVEVETAELPPGVLVRVSTVDDLGDRRVEPDERPFGDVDTALAHVGAWLRAWVGDG